MQAVRIVPSLDELETAMRASAVVAKLISIDKFTFKCSETALTKCVVIAVSD
jgi:hypothetical protein